MAHIVLPDGRELDEPDAATQLLDYYRGEGAEVTLDSDAAPVTFPQFSQPGDVGPHAADEPPPFNPSEHTVDEVNDHLATAPADEAQRVLDAEAADKARTGVLDGPHAVTDS